MSRTKQVKGVCFLKETSEEVIQILLDCMENKTRVILHWGNTETGKDEGLPKSGYIQKTAGENPTLILTYYQNSHGYSANSYKIVKIVACKTKEILYLNPNYHE